MSLLFDASSILQLISRSDEKDALRLLNGNHILDLTKYEVGNALWKEQLLHRAIGAEELREFLQLFQSLACHIKSLSIDIEHLSRVAELAVGEKLTFYDASYIAASKIHKLTLVTEDRNLARSASRHVKTTQVKDLRASNK